MTTIGGNVIVTGGTVTIGGTAMGGTVTVTGGIVTGGTVTGGTVIGGTVTGRIGSSGATVLERFSDIDMNQRVASVRSSWRKTLPGKEHGLVAEVELDRGWLERRIDGENLPVGGAANFERIENNGKRAESRFKLDYKKPLGEGRSLNLGYEVELADAGHRATG